MFCFVVQIVTEDRLKLNQTSEKEKRKNQSQAAQTQ